MIEEHQIHNAAEIIQVIREHLGDAVLFAALAKSFNGEIKLTSAAATSWIDAARCKMKFPGEKGMS